jgi:glycosyltransferase involved in cell wall biosynthesis
MMHTGCPNEWVVTTQAPFVWVVHGTPLAAFRAEQSNGHKSYSLYAGAAQWPRTKAMVYFWPEFKPYWDVVFPPEKSVILDFPPVDRERFSPDGEAYEIPRFQRGRYNGLICDSWRDDSDILELTHGALEAGRRIQGLTWHIYAVPNPTGPFEYLISALRKAGMLGTVGGRLPDMEQVYRGFDFVLSARRSISRVIAEALCCGTPVIAARKCTAASMWIDPEDPDEVASAVQALVNRLENDRDALQAETDRLAERFDLASYGQAMTRLYESILN